MRKIVLFSLMIVLSSCARIQLTELNFLVGTWKMEDKDQFEVWERTSANKISGFTYKIVNNDKTITETLLIKKMAESIIYEATVPDQNEGKTIQFVLNKKNDSLFSFENKLHDFPTKIQYKKIDDRKLLVSVKGSDGNGFSYIQIKQ